MKTAAVVIPFGIWMMLSVGIVHAREQVYYFHNDHLGTPQAMSDSAGRKVWEAEYEPFGQATVNQDPDGDGNQVINNLRFPGQYYDAESGLHYNYHRDYQPETGRYLQPDPIGLAGGLNHYNYVGSDPVNFVDPLGLVENSAANLARRQTIVDVANSYNGSHGFDFAAYLNSQYPANSWKCSGFVCTVLQEAGAPISVQPVGGGGARCATAGELANKNWNPSDWRQLGSGESPSPGDIAAYKLTPTPGEPYTYTGHTGIITSPGGNGIASHAVGVGSFSPTQGGIVYRRYTGE